MSAPFKVLFQLNKSEFIELIIPLIAKYESGRVENLKRDTIEKMSLLFNVSPAYLLGIDNNSETHVIPMILIKILI